MSLNVRLQQAIQIQNSLSECKVILINPKTFDELIEEIPVNYGRETQARIISSPFYCGIKVVRSEDIEEGKFEVY